MFFFCPLACRQLAVIIIINRFCLCVTAAAGAIELAVTAILLNGQMAVLQKPATILDGVRLAKETSLENFEKLLTLSRSTHLVVCLHRAEVCDMQGLCNVGGVRWKI